jgi:MFS family permease
VKEIRKIYLMHFLAGLSNAASVTFTLYFLSHGLKQVQIGELFGFFMICLAAFNIPTGGIADIFGHKASVAIGLLLQAISFLLFFLYPNYLGFMLGMFFNGVGLAFQAGATSSLIYELLHKESLHEDFQKIFGKANGFYLAAAMIGSPIGSIVYKFYPRFPYLLSFFFFLGAAIIAYLIKWEFKKKPYSIKYYYKTLTDGIMLAIRNRILMAIVIIGLALTVNRLVFNQNISQPYQLSVGIDVVYIGFIAAAVSGIQALININAYKISQKIGEKFSLLLIITIPSFSIIMLSFINSLLAIPFILLFYTGHAFRDPLFSHISQKEVTQENRSTMASTVSFLMGVLAAVMLPSWGKGIDLFGIHNSLFFLGLFTIAIGTVGLLIFSTKKIT